MIDELDDIVHTLTDKEVLGGLAGATSGYFLANRMGYEPMMTMGMIALGHFAGHSAMKMFN